MEKNQVCIADEPRFHTTKFVDTEKLAFKGTKLGLYVENLEKTISNQSNEINALKGEISTLKEILKGVIETEKLNADKVELLLLKNN